LVLSGHYISVLSRGPQQKPWCKLLGVKDVRNRISKTQYQQVYEGNEGKLTDRHHHPTTEEQTENA